MLLHGIIFSSAEPLGAMLSRSSPALAAGGITLDYSLLHNGPKHEQCFSSDALSVSHSKRFADINQLTMICSV